MRNRKAMLIMVALIAVAFAGNVWAATSKENAISSRVEHKLMEDSHFRNSHTKVDTNMRGEVTLHGTVASAADKDRATEIARSLDGVKSVDNDLTVSKTAASKY